MLKELAPRAPGINERNSAGETPLMLAVEVDAMPCVEALLDHHADANLDLHKSNALHLAAVRGDPNIVERLAKAVKDVNQIGWHRETPLMIAARNGHANAVRRLLTLKADAGCRNAGGSNAFHIAADYGKHEVLMALKPFVKSVDEQTAAGETALMLAAKSGYAEAVQTLLSFNADATLTDQFGRTALHFAAFRGEPDSVERLGKAVKDVNQVMHGHMTALMRAANMGHVEAVRRLLNCNARTDVKNSGGVNAFHIAAMTGRHKVLEALESFVEVDECTADGETALLLAALEGHAEAVDVLLKRGADPIHLNAPDENGRTHMMQAAMEGRWNAVKGLVQAGAEINCPDNDGVTPLMVANQSNVPADVMALLSR
ncbi:MAG: ankyrin repeat domain-containing protein [Burkholderiales bacterium]|nr:ankyrin repeat domain-containing protein [Burkholderiales bacterium]